MQTPPSPPPLNPKHTELPHTTLSVEEVTSRVYILFYLYPSGRPITAHSHLLKMGLSWKFEMSPVTLVMRRLMIVMLERAKAPQVIHYTITLLIFINSFFLIAVSLTLLL